MGRAVKTQGVQNRQIQQNRPMRYRVVRLRKPVEETGTDLFNRFHFESLMRVTLVPK